MFKKILAKCDFLYSVRFWKIVFAGFFYGLFQAGVIDTALFGMIETILVGSVTIRTVDRLGEQVGGTTTTNKESA